MTDNPRVFGKYDVIRRLAVGGMGEIFLAKQTGMAGFERLVILKSLLPQLAADPDQLAQFLDEARIVGSINHPNVVACYEVGEWEGVYFLALEYINGVDISLLQKTAEERGIRFPVNVALTVAREAALGLDSAHHAVDAAGRPLKIVHRDISPHNVMVRHDGLTKIVDFGVATAANRQKKTASGMLKGKLGYMAPEQIKGLPAESRSDQFSLGVTLWELLAGRRLFTAEDPSGVFMKIVKDKVEPPSKYAPDVPPEIDMIVLKMTQQEPQDRFGRLAEVAAVLRKLLDMRGAYETETADFVRDLVGGQLQERIRDLTPSPVRIMGVASAEEPPMSGSFCASCGTRAVRGDRFCRSCGAPLHKTRNIPVPEQAKPLAAPPIGPIDDAFADDAAEAIDVAFDDASSPAETGAVVGQFELGADVPPPELMRPLSAHLDELAARLGGSVSVIGARFTATFVGNGRAARAALLFARRAAQLAPRAQRGLWLRAGVGGVPGLTHGDDGAKEDAERLLALAPPATVLVSDRARRLAVLAVRCDPSGIQAPAVGEQPAIVPLVLVPPPLLVGRSNERHVIEQALAAADAGKGQQHLLLGGAGAGKSTLLALAEDDARERGFVIARARAGACAAPLRYDAVRQAVRGAALELNALVGTEGAWTRALETLSLPAADRARLQALVDGVPGDDDVPLSRRRLLVRAAVVRFFAVLAERRGVCILIDDIHAADPSSAELFAELGARLHAARFALFATSRPTQGERVLPLAKRIVLEAMGRDELIAVASLAIGALLVDDAAAHLADAAQQSPLYAARYAVYLASAGMLRIADGVGRAAPELARFPAPPTMSVLAFAAQSLLPPPVRELLVQAAALGAAFDVAELTTLLQKDAAPLFAAALQAGVLVGDGEGRCAFPSSTERDVAAARADPVWHGQWHRRIATLLESRADAHGRRAVDVEERLAHHLTVVGDRERAAAASERAAAAWVRIGAVDACAEHFRRALNTRWRAAAADPQAADLGLRLAAQATTALAETNPQAAADVALPLLRRAAKTATAEARAEALRARGAVLARLRRLDDAQEQLDAALALMSPAGRGPILVDLAAVDEHRGDVDQARARLKEALRLLGAAKDAAARARAVEAMVALGRLHLRAKAMAEAREVLTLALEDARRRKSVADELEAAPQLAALAQAEGRLDEAADVFAAVATLAERAGDGIVETRARQALARVLQQQGKTAQALAEARTSQALALRLSWDEGVALASQLVAALE